MASSQRRISYLHVAALGDLHVTETHPYRDCFAEIARDADMLALHYAPIAATCEGEPKEIYPFLGSSRFSETVNRFDNVKAVVHGHAAPIPASPS